MPEIVDLVIVAGLVVGAASLRGISLSKFREKSVQKGLALGVVSLLWGLAIYAPSLFVLLGFPERGVLAAQSLTAAFRDVSANEFLNQYSAFLGILGSFVTLVGSRYLKRYLDEIFWLFVVLCFLAILGSITPF